MNALRHGWTIALCAAALGGCAAPSSTKVMGGAPGLGCHAAGAAAVLGQSPDEHVLQDAMRGSGALRTQVIRPGAVPTTDVDPMRLNIELDAEGHIHRMRCG